MDIEKLIERLNQYSQSLIAYKLGADFADACMDAATALSTIQAENEKLRNEVERQRRSADDRKHLYENAERAYMKVVAELERVKRGNNALWTYIEIVDREYRRYMDRGYIDRLDELKKVWKRGQKED